VVSGTGYRDWTVTTQVRRMYEGQNNGFLIRDSAENATGFEQQFSSRENSVNEPELVIIFGPASDTTPPDTSITGKPTDPSSSVAPTFTFTGTDNKTPSPSLLEYECRLDTQSFDECVNPQSYADLALGAHTFEVRAVDLEGNVDPTPVKYTWTIETTPPETTIDLAPSAETEETSASFTFSANETGSTFECSLDGATFAACSSPKTYTGLEGGSHEFRVRAVDPAANVDASPASHSWTVSTPQEPTCAAATVTAGADADSWVLQGSSGNYGSDSILKVDSKSGGNARALVRFALPALPARCQVVSVKLRMHASSVKDGRTLQALRLGAAWTENGVTWNNQPAATGAAATAASGSGYVEWSVTGQVQSMYSSGNYGFLIRDSVESGLGFEQGFHSREKGTDSPPQLIITFG
jgi:hypothetical protein